MTNRVEDLHTDLLYMRKGLGFAAARIIGAGTLRFVLGGDNEPFEHLRERFVSAIGSLHDHDRDVLLAAFGLSKETAGMRTLKQRREQYGKQIDRGIDTVADREDAALVHLRSQLLTGWYPASPLSVRVPELHNGIVQESVSILTIVKDQRWHETREQYRFFAAFDQADYLTISSDWPGRPVPLPEGKSPFTVRTRRVGDSYSHDFIHHTPMIRGNTYDLAFKIVPDPDSGNGGTDDLLTETSRAFHERTLTAQFETVFIGAKPQTIWSYERLSFFERPGNPTTSNTIDLTNTSSATTGFRDQYGGLFCGMGWRW